MPTRKLRYPILGTMVGHSCHPCVSPSECLRHFALIICYTERSTVNKEENCAVLFVIALFIPERVNLPSPGKMRQRHHQNVRVSVRAACRSLLSLYLVSYATTGAPPSVSSRRSIGASFSVHPCGLFSTMTSNRAGEDYRAEV
jgi:hypothetical protein